MKDNIDVAGLTTTAGCPTFSYQPAYNAHCVQRLIDAGDAATVLDVVAGHDPGRMVATREWQCEL